MHVLVGSGRRTHHLVHGHLNHVWTYVHGGDWMRCGQGWLVDENICYVPSQRILQCHFAEGNAQSMMSV